MPFGVKLYIHLRHKLVNTIHLSNSRVKAKEVLGQAYKGQIKVRSGIEREVINISKLEAMGKPASYKNLKNKIQKRKMALRYLDLIEQIFLMNFEYLAYICMIY